MIKLIFLILPLLFLSCKEEKIVEKIVEKPVIVEKIIDKPDLITKQENINDISSKIITGTTQKKVYIISDGKNIIAIHLNLEYAHKHRQELINQGKNAIIYESKGVLADIK